MGKWLIFLGFALIAAGIVATILDRFGIFKLPGDLQFGSKNWHIFLPITSCIIISVVLTVILWIINFFRK